MKKKIQKIVFIFVWFITASASATPSFSVQCFTQAVLWGALDAQDSGNRGIERCVRVSDCIDREAQKDSDDGFYSTAPHL